MPNFHRDLTNNSWLNWSSTLTIVMTPLQVSHRRIVILRILCL